MTQPQPQATAEHRLAAAFARVLREWLTDAEMALAIARNSASEDPSVCASHDFCDPNMAMLEAFKSLHGRDPLFLHDVEDGFVTQAASDADLGLFNKAWDLAKAASFDAEQITILGDEAVLEAAMHAALDEGCRMIQDHLGVSTGDFAGLYFSGPASEALKVILRGYLSAERAQSSDD